MGGEAGVRRGGHVAGRVGVERCGALGGKRPRRPFVVGVVGPSGVGKSTLAAAVAALRLAAFRC